MSKAKITNYLVVDLEATCWESPFLIEEQEIIEIGAVMLDMKNSRIEKEYSCFIKPKLNPTLSEFCKTLTTISQEEINNAGSFDVEFNRFLDWISIEEFTLCSWGIYDVKQIKSDCNRYNLDYPDSFSNHINLKKLFADVKGVAPKSVVRALEHLSLKFSGTHHRGIDDARNIARVAQEILPLSNNRINLQ